jgi:hypothetical protein
MMKIITISILHDWHEKYLWSWGNKSEISRIPCPEANWVYGMATQIVLKVMFKHIKSEVSYSLWAGFA